MAIIPKVLLHEILLRFSSGMEHQVKAAGELEGAHVVTFEHLIDDATGKVVGQTHNPQNGQAQPIAADDVKALLGDQVATLVAQLGAAEATAKKDAAAAAQALADAQAKHGEEIAALNGTIADLTAQLQAATHAHAVVTQRVAAAAATLAG